VVTKQTTPSVAFLHRVGLALGSLTHAALTTQGAAARRGQLDAFRTAIGATPAAAARPNDETPSPRESDRGGTTATT
jgi:hypothetical protein